MNGKAKGIIEFVKQHWQEMLCSLLFAYLSVSVVNIFIIDESAANISFVNSYKTLISILLMAAFFSYSFFLSMLMKIKSMPFYMLFVSVIVFALMTVQEADKNIHLAVCICAVAAAFIMHLTLNGHIFSKPSNLSRIAAFALACVIFVLLTYHFAVQTIYRYKIFGASCYDFGIFAQMYKYMAKTGIPYTTCERAGLLSHFFIHFSPTFYVTLPVYFIAQRQETLLVIQSMFVFGSIFPAYLICRRHGFSPALSLVLASGFVITPGMVAPMFYDFHENKLLMFFLLWFLYFMECDKYKLSFVFLLLTLGIKEDAFIYPLFLLIYNLVFVKRSKQRFLLLGATLVYAAAVLLLMRKFSFDLNLSTQLNSRYGIYLQSGERGSIKMAANILKDPAFLVKSVFTTDKLTYIFYTLGAFLFIPCANKKLKTLFLLIPFLAVNLMSSWTYQSNIGYQYTYGPLALIFYSFIINTEDFGDRVKTAAVICVPVLSAILTLNAVNTGLYQFTRQYDENPAMYRSMEEALDRIPEGTSVASETFLLPHIIDNTDEIYLFPYDKEKTDYVVLATIASDDNTVSFRNNAEENGYTLAERTDRVEIYKRNDAPPLKDR